MKRVSIGLALVMISISIRLSYATCQDNWTAGQRASHTNCQAGEIDAGVPYYNGSQYGTTPFRHHKAYFNKPGDSDVDCHQKTNCSYEDVSENQFVCIWKVQILSGSEWEDCAYQVIDYDCAGMNWNTTAYQPGRDYRAKVWVNDTSGDGPHGDDDGEYRYSGSIDLKAPEITGFHMLSGFPTHPPGGSLYYEYNWNSTCSHRTHLDKVVWREKVTYESQFTSAPPYYCLKCKIETQTQTCPNCGRQDCVVPEHYTSHPTGDPPQPANCFNSKAADPTIGGGPGTDDGFADTHPPFNVPGAMWQSYCGSSQVYQWATGWPAPPNMYSDAEDWNTLETNAISRSIVAVENPPRWRYRVQKDEEYNDRFFAR